MLTEAHAGNERLMTRTSKDGHAPSTPADSWASWSFFSQGHELVQFVALNWKTPPRLNNSITCFFKRNGHWINITSLRNLTSATSEFLLFTYGLFFQLCVLRPRIDSQTLIYGYERWHFFPVVYIPAYSTEPFSLCWWLAHCLAIARRGTAQKCQCLGGDG